LSRGSNPCGYPHKPLVSYRINRQLSGWIPPPLMIRAFGAHCQDRTHAPQHGHVRRMLERLAELDQIEQPKAVHFHHEPTHRWKQQSVPDLRAA
jgi:D-hexose-6-phosphate mutarotase